MTLSRVSFNEVFVTESTFTNDHSFSEAIVAVIAYTAPVVAAMVVVVILDHNGGLLRVLLWGWCRCKINNQIVIAYCNVKFTNNNSS